MLFDQEDEIIEVIHSLKENIEPNASEESKNNASSNLLQKNSKSTNAPISPSSSSSSCITTSKRYSSKFKKEWLSNPQYSAFLKECKNDSSKALCFICNVQFSIHNSGITDINNHMKTKRHQECIKSAEVNKSKTINSLLNSNAPELNRLCAVEGALVYHGVKHSYSYLSQSCTVNLSRKCFSDSSIAKNITCSKTKAREIACNVLAPTFTNSIIKELREVSFFSICYDASNKGNAKMLPVVTQYFSKFGVKHGIIEFIQQQHESADSLFLNIKYVLESNGLNLKQLSALGSDNTNVNVGNHHSVFSLFKQLVPHLIKGSCYCHVLHNSVKHGHKYLLFDVEAALLKIYSYFCRSSVRSQELAKYFEFIDQEQQVLLQHIRIRWLSLLQSIERLIIVYPAVKSYFLNMDDGECPKILLELFTSNNEECSLHFLKNILTDVQEANLLLQKHYITGVNLHSILTNLLHKLKNRLHDEYFGSKVMELLESIPHSNEVNDLKKSFRVFIDTIIQYIEGYYNDRANFYKSISIFSEVNIDKIEWKDVECCIAFINNNNIDRDYLYNDFICIRSKFIELKSKCGSIHKQVQEFISSKLNLSKKDDITLNNEKPFNVECDIQADSDSEHEETDVRHHKEHNKHPSIRCDHLWAFLIHEENVPNLRNVLEFAFSIPASNAFCESIFSHMKFLWSNYRNKMKPELVGAELKVKVNSQLNCTEFYDYLLNNQDLLKQIRSSDKYTHVAKIPRRV
ncbi:unnamed protein product [Rotaria magnacalcarata]|uniref:HAT C-terminal dimerisation domain-containing protein n=1 Tax=Rotaria magnacalcarata TaxID=392030 RepID=A0A816LH86_9BILA|nr:unnamed protein product [Rotaria magnacalcarata]